MDPESPRHLELAVEQLARGGVVGLPTETVYGLAAVGTNPGAVREIFALKGRPPSHPLILHLGDASWLPRFASPIPAAAWRLAQRFWPGPLTMVLRRTSQVPNEVTGGLETVGLRVPRHPVALEVLRRLDQPLAAPSANLFGRVSPTTRAHVVADFGERLELVLEGGPSELGVESTIVDLSGPTPRLLRHGQVTRAELEAVLETSLEELTLQRDNDVRAPGMLASHYAPRARVELSDASSAVARISELSLHGPAPSRIGAILHGLGRVRLEGLGRLVPRGHLPELDFAQCVRVEAPSLSDRTVELVVIEGGSAEVARSLYSALRYLDEEGVTDIVACLPDTAGVGLAVQDRLNRAASPRPGAERSAGPTSSAERSE